MRRMEVVEDIHQSEFTHLKFWLWW